MTPLLQVSNLTISFKDGAKKARAVRDVSFDVKPAEIVGLVGESGSGKSVMSYSIIGLLPKSNSIVETGKVLFEEHDLLEYNTRQMTKIRGKDISMIFQEPMTSLNPVYTIGNQLEEVFVNHGYHNRSENHKKAIALLDRVGIPRIGEVMKSYPHQLSGGMRQRVMIAMAIALKPKLLIADEPVTALDVTIQAQILRLIEQLAREDNMAVIFISHNLGVIAQLCERVMVMYSGQIVEIASIRTLYQEPSHPYTINLFECIPQSRLSDHKLNSIKGTVPHPGDEIAGCRFSPRCKEAIPVCSLNEPRLIKVGAQHYCRCLLRMEVE